MILGVRDRDRVWEVTGPPQYIYAQPGSISYRDGFPVLVDLRVKPGRGIHD